MSGPFASLVEGKYRKDAAKAAAKLAEQQQRAGQQLVNELDYEPMYASQNVPTYQRSQSPIARSYLESMLAGNNPASTFSGAPNAGVVKQRQQSAQDQMFGTMQERVQKQRALETNTPWWKVTTPTRQVNPNRGTDEGAGNYTAQHSDFAALGINKSLADALNETGTNLDALKLQATNKGSTTLDNIMKFSSTSRGVGDILKTHYNGNANQMAADVRAAGGLEALYKQLQQKGRG